MLANALLSSAMFKAELAQCSHGYRATSEVARRLDAKMP